MSQQERLVCARTYFELFDLPVRFTLERQLLESRYLQLARATHPDLAATDTAAQMAAMQLSAKVNEAYAILRDDLKRAEYILRIRNQKPAEPSTQTLSRVFDLRESLSTNANDHEAVRHTREEASRWLDETMAHIALALDTPNAGTKAAELVATARYLQKIIS